MTPTPPSAMEPKMKHVHDLKILDKILARGLCSGSGNGTTTFCLEQAVAVICGLPVTDHPDECVTPAVSAFGRKLNDSRWESEAVRAAGCRDFAIAQIGSKGVVDGVAFACAIALKMIQRVLPLWLRYGKIDEALVVACEQAVDLDAGHKAAVAARDAARKKRADDAAAYAAAAYAAAYAAAAAAADAYAAVYADAYAAVYADAAVYAAAYAAAVADADAARVRAVALPLAASLAVEVLRELRSPGVELLGAA